MSTTSMLRLDGVRKHYRGIRALRNISFEVARNEIFALLGPTGAGKSSTLLSIAGLVEPDNGQVFLDGVDITQADPASRDVSIVFEGFNLLPVLDVKDNIAFPLRSPTYRQDEQEIMRRVQQMAELLRISHLLDRDVETLSGGEKQRVAIARALVRSPKLFLLDEPLSALDLKLREGLRAELKEIHNRDQSTILYATHDYHGAIAIADRIGIIDGGILHQAGTIDEIYECPANALVGRLIGSPAMAFFEAVMENGSVRIIDGQQSIPLSGFGKMRADSGERVHLGVWPEDIVIVDPGTPDSNAGSVYAVDNRGFERAIQVNMGANSFRKVVAIDSSFRQNDPCSFVIAPNAGFLFDRVDGQRLSHLSTGDAP